MTEEEPKKPAEVGAFWDILGMLVLGTFIAVTLFGFVTVGLAVMKLVWLGVNWAWNW